MELAKVQRIKELKRIADKLSTLIDRYKEVAGVGNCDKYDLGFNRDSRFAMFKLKHLSLDCYTGYYGNSSCGTFDHVPDEDAKRLFVSALNKNLDAILKDMAILASNEATKIKNEAEKELAEANELLASV